MSGSQRTASRRWQVKHKRDPNRVQWTEDNITPDEARVALEAICIQYGNTIFDTLDYNPISDKFTIKIVDWDGVAMDFEVPGETVGGVVKLARYYGHGDPSKPLIHNSDRVIARNKAIIDNAIK